VYVEAGEGQIRPGGAWAPYDTESLVFGALWQVRPYQVASVAPSNRSAILADMGTNAFGWDDTPAQSDPLGALVSAFDEFELGAMERHADTARAIAEGAARQRDRHALLEAREVARAEAAKHGGGLTGYGAGTETAVASAVLAMLLGGGALARARKHAEA